MDNNLNNFSNSEAVDILKKLTSATAISGEENEAFEIAKEYLKDYGEIKSDNFGNLICIISPYKKGGVNLLLDAHMDEIGFAVVDITNEGFLKIADISGNDIRVLTASEVYIISGEKKYAGLITSKPPHLSSKDEYKKPTPLSEAAVDVGMDKQAAEKIFKIGDKVVLKGELKLTPTGRVISKALDNRASCFALIEAAKKLKDKKLDIGLAIALSTQEEVGLRGASAVAYALEPTHAIVVDVTFGDKEIYPGEMTFSLSKGPSIAVGPVLNKEMAEDIMIVAKQNKIPYAIEVAARGTGTNADKISLVKTGIKTALISPPIKNMHSRVEMLDLADIHYVSELIFKYIEFLNKEN